jgi:hypothetical protein
VPGTDLAVRTTNAYRVRLLALRQRAAQAIAARWAGVAITDLDGTFEEWVAAAAAQLEAAQRAGVLLTDGYLAAYLAAELGRNVTALTSDPARYAGVDQLGRPLAVALTPALITIKVGIGQGRPTTEAIRLGRARALRTVVAEAMAAPRAALSDLMQADDRIDGWRRVTSPRPCGACLALATETVLPPTERLHQHNGCRCTAEPRVRGVRETVFRPTGRQLFDGMSPAEQDQLFAGRGGAAKADLIRSGRVPLEALVARAPMATTDDMVTEATLGDLQARAT